MTSNLIVFVKNAYFLLIICFSAKIGYIKATVHVTDLEYGKSHNDSSSAVNYQ